MTQSEINKLHKSIATDFKIATIKTELWTMDYCYQLLHDIKKFMTFGYLNTVYLVMDSHADIALKVKKYIIVSVSRAQDDRPGNIDWEDGEGKKMHIIVSYTPSYQQLSDDQKIAFQRDNLRNSWYNSNVDTNFTHLSKSVSKVYTHASVGVDRIDFN